jgi:hypothetical protein
VNELDAEWMGSEDPLVHRLRNLEWANVSPEVRARCWKRINQRVVEQPSPNGKASDAASLSRARDTGERYAFSRRESLRRPAVAHAWRRAPVRALARASAAISS